MTLNGSVDSVTGTLIAGWVSTTRDLGEPILIEAWLDAIKIGEGTANIPRSDLSATGFQVCLADGGSSIIANLVSRRLKIVACQGSVRRTLKIWRVLEAVGILEQLNCIELRAVVGRLPGEKRKSVFDIVQEYYHGVSDAEGAVWGTWSEQVSDDEAAVVGANGHIFLYQGNNRLLDLYRSREVPRELCSRWSSVIQERIKNLNRKSIRYCQIMVPEKSTILSYLVPYQTNGGSLLWFSIIRMLRENRCVSECLIDGRDVLNRECDSELLFLQRDSHLSTLGCLKVVTAFCKMYAGDVSFKLGACSWEERIGDLGRRFAKMKDARPERVMLFQDLCSSAGQTLVPVLRSSDDPSYGHQGTRRVWHCAEAPIDQRLVCFGNSFFERGRTSTHLSWWFARLFREFHFVWSADVQYDYIDSVCPDAVIGQSIERFLGNCPLT